MIASRAVCDRKLNDFTKTVSCPHHEDTLCEDTRLSRRQEVERLCTFQRQALIKLEAELAIIDCNVEKAEMAVIEANNRVQALRGLVQSRNAARPTQNADRAKQVEKRSTEKHSGEQLDELKSPSTPSVLDASVKVQSALARRKRSKFKASADDEVSDAGSKYFALPAVGTIYSDFSKRFEAPRQSFQGPAGNAVLVLRNDDEELATLQSRTNENEKMLIWILYWLDRNAGFWREKVRPPRARGGWRVGVFATRSPHRPTAVGLSLAEVTKVDTGNTARIHVRGVDILDETPLIGWKCYDHETEAHWNVSSGWLDDADMLQPLYYDQLGEVADTLNALDGCKVLIPEDVREKLNYVDQRSVIDVLDMIQRALSRVRLSADGRIDSADGRSELMFDSGGKFGDRRNCYPVGAWRIWYAWDESEKAVVVEDVTSGIREDVLLDEEMVDREVREHKEFIRRFS